MGGGATRRAILALAASLILGACGHHIRSPDADTAADDGANAYPANYRSDILAAMHAYLNNPTGIRDAAISEPALKASGNATRYLVCLKFNAKKNASEYAGTKEIAASFLVGRFDHFIEVAREQCAGTSYTPFPELQKLPP
jgi:hypothetical protein